MNKLLSFYKKLTLLAKILLGIITISIITCIILCILSIRHLSNNQALYNKSSKTFITTPGWKFKSITKYSKIDLTNNPIEYTLLFQTNDLKLYETKITIMYDLNKDYIIETSAIPDKLILDEMKFNHYIFNSTINYDISMLIKNNKQLLTDIIKNYFNDKEFRMYTINMIYFNSPFIVK
jgi:hypothetical protein